MIFSATCLMVIACTASAQDKILLQNGGIINAKVKEVSPRTITYKKSDNPDGPDFVIRNDEVESITYANGTKDRIYDRGDDRDDRRRQPRDRNEHSRMSLSSEKYPKNILSIAPLQMANEGPAGIGLHYERVLDKKSMFSFYLPAAVIFYNSNQYNYISNSSENKTRAFCYFYPGIKVYPTGSNRRVSYGVGPSIALGFGNKRFETGYNGTNYTYEDKSVFKSGLLLNNSLNIQPTKNLYIGLELGLGFTYYNSENNNNGYYNSGVFDSDVPLVQFNFAIGYRF